MGEEASAQPRAGPPANGESRAHSEILSERLLVLLDDVLEGRAPNAGRFCGYCYHPLAPERNACPHCGRLTSEWAPAAAVPRAVFAMHRRRRGREGLVVRTIAWGGLTIGVIVALLPFVFADVTWWSVLAFFGLLFGFYVLSANLANSVGDAIGYRWGQAIVQREWTRFTAERDGIGPHG
jgi:hypothetical protein